MKDVSSQNFGLLIAYIVPGVTALLGAAEFSDTVRRWLMGAAGSGPTVGGFLYLTLAAVAAGVIVSTIRWAVIDTLHHATGISRPNWDFGKLQRHFDAYDRLEQNHYRYYQHYGAMVVSLLFVWISRRMHQGFAVSEFPAFDIAILLLTAIYFAGSRDTLAKFYTRTSQLLADSSASRDERRTERAEAA